MSVSGEYFWYYIIFNVLILLQCRKGYAGDGILCGPDKDMDGYPDNTLKCKDKHCVKVTLKTTYASKQWRQSKNDNS